MEFSDYQELCDAGQIKTPAYIFDTDVLRRRIRYIRSRLPGMGICYAMKANPFLVGAALGEADSFEICSPGEERICERAQIPAGQMVLSGVNKEAADFERIFTYTKEHAEEGRPICTVESLQQAAMLETQAAAVYGDGQPVDILLRVTTGTQFGMEEEDVLRIVRERSSYPHLRIRGIQMFSGTQKKMRTIKKEIAEADALIARIEKECAFRIDMFEFGPGLQVSYFKKDKPVDDDALLSELYETLAGMRWKGEISLEMGRFIAASCGSYITRIMDMKRNRDVNYLICDGGIHQVNYYGQMMAMKLPYMLARGGEVPLPTAGSAYPGLQSAADSVSPGSEPVRGSKCAAPTPETGHQTDTPTPITGQQAGAPTPVTGQQAGTREEVYTICGSLCTINDVIVKEVPLQHPEVDDILVFMNVGAYSVTEGISLFLSRDLPRVYRMEGGEVREIRTKIQTEEFNYG